MNILEWLAAQKKKYEMRQEYNQLERSQLREIESEFLRTVYKYENDKDMALFPKVMHSAHFSVITRRRKEVKVQKGKSAARYTLSNMLSWDRGDYEKNFVFNQDAQQCYLDDRFCTEGEEYDVSEKKINFLQMFIDDEQADKHWYVIKKVDAPAEDLPFVSKTRRTRKKRVKAETPFFKQIRKDVTKAGRQLRKHSFGAKVLAFVRRFYKTAKDLSLSRPLREGFIFSFSHSKFQEKYGYKKAECNRLLNTAAALGFITKITPIEAKGIGEYWHKKFGVGILQFKLRPLNVPDIRKKWLIFVKADIKVRNITIKLLEEILNVDITTHPEATDRELRKIILDINKIAEEEQAVISQQKEKENSVIKSDPFDIGHGKYYVKMNRTYTVEEAKTLLADIKDDHDSHSIMGKFGLNLESPNFDISYSVISGGNRIVYRKNKLGDLPKELLIREYEWKSARKATKDLISQLYLQGLVGIVTHFSLQKGFNRTDHYDCTYGFFLQSMNTGRRRCNY